jgi:hypothetical protein
LPKFACFNATKVPSKRSAKANANANAGQKRCRNHLSPVIADVTNPDVIQTILAHLQ